MMNYLSKFDISKTTTFTNHFSHYNDSDKNRLELTYESKYNVVRKNANVYIKIINKGFIGFIKSSLLSMNYKFIKYKTDDKIIFININSLSKRLGISKKNISKVKSNQKQLDLLIKNHHEKYIETEKKIEREIDTECEKALKNYQQNNTKLSNSNGSHLSINTLRKAISNAVISKFDVRQKEIVIRSKKGKIIHIKKQENNETPLITLFTKKLLGQGAYGRVEVTQDLLSGKTTVAKIALDPFSKKDARNEYEILKKLENEDQTGLQKRPYLIFDFDFNYDNYYGYLAPKYDNSLQSVMDSDLSSNEKLECARQILKGLVTLKKQQICHGDIKPGNCLVKKHSNGSIECVLSDFGGAKDMTSARVWPTTHTSYFDCKKDRTAYNELMKQHSKNKMPFNVVKKLAFQRDVFATAILLEQLLFNLGSDLNIPAEDSFALSNLIVDMRNTSWEKRMTAENALETFEKIFPSNIA